MKDIVKNYYDTKRSQEVFEHFGHFWGRPRCYITQRILVTSNNWCWVIVGSVVNRTTVGGHCKLLRCEVNPDLKPERDSNAIYRMQAATER